MAAISARNITKRFGRHLALDDVSVEMADGSFVVLLGPSGCGKTTLLNTIAGFERPDAGSIQIDGQPIDHLGPAARDIGFVFQNYALYPHKTVWGNLAFALRFRSISLTDGGRSTSDRARRRAAIDARVREVAQSLRIDSLLERYPGQLSGGQRQRVAMGRALVRRPRAFLFDEPLSNLDASLRTSVRSEIKDLQKSLGTTTLYVTHDQVEAMTLADRIVVMQNARVLQVGTPHEIYDEPANIFVGTFVGSPAMSLLAGVFVEESDGAAIFRTGAEAIAVPALIADRYQHLFGRNLVLGVRSEDTSLVDRFSSSVKVCGALLGSDFLGNSTVLRIGVGTGELRVASSDAYCQPEDGARVTAFIDMERVHVFDGATERSLLRKDQ